MIQASGALAPLALIAAMDRNGLVGRDNGLPWHLPADMRFFRRMTVGHAVLVGRSTFASFGRPLPGRSHFVLSRQVGLCLPGAQVFHCFDEALRAARSIDPCPFVVGGSQLYRQALPVATLMYLTEIDEEYEGDTHFPAVEWRQWEQRHRHTEGALSFVTYTRIQSPGGGDGESSH